MTDKFVNRAYGIVVESSVNTLSFSEIHTGLAIFEKIAWVIHRIQWFLADHVLQELVANTDHIEMALVGSNQIAAITLADQAIYDYLQFVGMVSGTPADGFIHMLPFLRDFSSLPGGGIIIPPRPIYVAVKGSGLVTPAAVSCRILYTHKELKADEYWELVEATRIVQ